MKKLFLIAVYFFLIVSTSISQNIVSIANEKMNIFYLGLDNPVSLAAEGFYARDLIIKTINGKITKDYSNNYNFRPDSLGRCEIILYAKVKGRLKEIGRSAFRSKNLPLPNFHIGSKETVKYKAELVAQEYVRAQLENFDIDVRYSIDSFKVYIYSSDTCKNFSITQNLGNKLNEEVKLKFQKLRQSDVIVFKDIYIKQPDGSPALLEPLIITLKE